jgi:large exoprotein involved in heme utilization and adhesion
MESGAQVVSTNGRDWASSQSNGSGGGGDISIAANDTIRVSGGSLDLFTSTKISSQAFREGQNGNITLSVPHVVLKEGGTIQSLKSFSGSGNPGQHGNIQITSNDLSITGAFDFDGELQPSGVLMSTTGPLVGSSGQPSLPSGEVSIRSTSVTIDGGFIITSHGGNASGGNIVFDATNLSVTGGGSISALGEDNLPTGRILITAQETVSVSGQADGNLSTIQNIANGTGNGGDISITAGRVEISQQGRLSTQTRGLDGRSISITASDRVEVSSGGKIRIANGGFDPGNLTITSPSLILDQGILQTSTVGSGRAGDVAIHADNVSLSGGQINSETQQVLGRGGDILIEASGQVSISGRFTGNSIDLPGLPGIFTSTHNFGGDAGNINIRSPQIQITDGGVLSATSTGTGNAGSISVKGLHSPADSVLIDGAGSGLFTDTQGTGAGGNIFVNANSVTLQDGGTLSAKTSGTDATATGGSITVNTTDRVTMTSGASITASSTGPGNAGNISINAGQKFEMRNSSVKTETAQASGGNIDIQAVDRVRLVNSSISTSVLGGAGSGGNITIDPNVVVLQNSQVIAQAVQGAGGNITITTPLFLADSTSLVSASSQFGLNGTVTIQSPTSNLSGSLGTLTSKPSQAQSLLTQRCAALVNGQASSFVVAGREHLPADPGGWLTSPLALAGIDAEQFGDGTLAEGTSNREPRTSGLLANDRVLLRRLTPAEFLIANFADREATGCHS